MAGYEEEYAEYQEQKSDTNFLKSIPGNYVLVILGMSAVVLWMVQTKQMEKEWALAWVGLIGAALLFFSQTIDNSIYITLKQAENIVWREVLDRQLYSQKFPSHVPEGKIEIGKSALVLDPWEGKPLLWRIGIGVRDSSTDTPWWYVAEVDILRKGLGFQGLKSLSSPYNGEDKQVVYVPVPGYSDIKEADNFWGKKKKIN